MATFEQGDLVMDRQSGTKARVVSVQGKTATLQAVGQIGRYGMFNASIDDLEDVYEYEREAGHYGLTPKGIAPPL